MNFSYLNLIGGQWRLLTNFFMFHVEHYILRYFIYVKIFNMFDHFTYGRVGVYSFGDCRNTNPLPFISLSFHCLHNIVIINDNS